MNLLAVVGLITFVAALLVGVYILINGRRKIHFIWFFFTLSVAWWGIGIFKFTTTFDIDKAIFWWRIAEIGVILIPSLLAHFVSKFLEERGNKLVYALYTLAAIFIFTDIFTNYFVNEVRFAFNQFYYITATPLYSFFIAVFLGTAVYNVIKLYKKFRKSDSIGRQKIKYVIIAFLIGFSGGATSFLPVYNIDVYPVYNITILVAAFTVFYAVFKHGLLNVKTIFTQLFVFSLWSFLVGKILLAEDLREKIIDVTLLILVVIFGILIIRSVMAEIQARQHIQKLAKDLEAANVELKKLDKAKSEFLSIASHQLRTPLTAIKGYSSMILEGAFGKFSEGVKDATGKILESSRQLVLMIDDFLDISKIEAGKMSYEFSTFNLDDLIKKMVKGFLDNNKKARELNLKYITSNQDFRVRGDINKISQVVSNLLDNAVKYTPTGYINVHLDKNQKGDAAILTVKDTGIGISKETMAKLFQKFSRSEKSSLFNTSGSGLGLYVAKRIITDHKGRIWVESDGPGKGSGFFVELPLG